MTDRGPCSRAELDGRRVVVDLSDADLARLTAIAARRGVDGPQLVLGWIRRALLTNHIWAGPTAEPERAERIARDVETAQRAENQFRDLLDNHE